MNKILTVKLWIIYFEDSEQLLYNKKFIVDMKSQRERHVRHEDEREVVCTNHQTGFSVDYNNYIFQLTFFPYKLCIFMPF